MVCPNCGREMGCSCMRRTSLGGIPCCTMCVTSLNNKYREEKRHDNKFNRLKQNNLLNPNRRNVLI